MPQIGTLLTGAGVVTTISQEFLPAYLQIGNIDDANVLTALRVATKGGDLINLSNAARIGVLATLDNEPSIAAGASFIPQRIRLANGNVQERTQISLTNVGVTTPAIFGQSYAQSGDRLARRVVESSINVTSNQLYKGFEYLYFLPAQVNSVELTFRTMDGGTYTDNFTPAELEGIFSEFFYTEATALVGGHIVIAGTANPINQVLSAKIFNAAGGATTVVATSYTIV